MLPRPLAGYAVSGSNSGQHKHNCLGNTFALPQHAPRETSCNILLLVQQRALWRRQLLQVECTDTLAPHLIVAQLVESIRIVAVAVKTVLVEAAFVQATLVDTALVEAVLVEAVNVEAIAIQTLQGA